MDALKVVTQLHDLAINPKNRSAIVKDQGCLPGLVLFLDNNDKIVVEKALETLHLLALHGPNRKLMREELGMITSLKSLSTSSSIDKRAKEMAQTIHEALKASKPRKAPTNSNQQLFLGNSNKRARIIILAIEGMLNLEHRKMVESQLLHVKGVISFTFDMSKHRCTIRARSDIKAATLCEKINVTKVMTANQIVKNESGEEVVMSFGKTPLPAKKDESSIPDYLPEDDELPGDKAITKVSTKEDGSGWFSNVSSFISSSLYW